MRAYVVNLARRPDRMRAIAAQLDAVGIVYERIDAVDAQSTPDSEIDKHFLRTFAYGELSKGDKCCSLSHIRLFEAFLKTGDAHALVFEDDALLDIERSALLKSDNWIPPDVAIVKLERYWSSSPQMLLGRGRKVAPGFEIAPLYAKHMGTAGYIISRRAAEEVLSVSAQLPVPIDHLLFNPNTSPLFKKLRPYQLLPALVAQPAESEESDIYIWRKGIKKKRTRKQKLLHDYLDARLLPLQIFRVLTLQGRLVRIPQVQFSQLNTKP